MKGYVCALSISFLLIGCGDDGPTATSPAPLPVVPEKAAYDISLQPDPVTAGISDDPDFLWQYSVTLTLRETAGLSANLDSIFQFHVDLDSGLRTRGFNRGANDIVRIAGTNHLPANRQLSVPLGTLLSLPGGPKQAMVVVELKLTDSNGNITETAVQGRILLPRAGRSLRQTRALIGEAPEK